MDRHCQAWRATEAQAGTGSSAPPDADGPDVPEARFAPGEAVQGLWGPKKEEGEPEDEKLRPMVEAVQALAKSRRSRAGCPLDGS